MYSEGDETTLLPIFNKYYGEYGGFVPRTLQHWVWCCKLHPDIGSEGIFVACHGHEIVGYAAVGRLSQQEGGYIIYELAYNPAYDGQSIVSALINRVSVFVEEQRGNYITFPAPSDDRNVREVCDVLAFRETPLNEVIGFIIFDTTTLIEHIIEQKRNHWKGGDGTFLIQLNNLPPPHNHITVQLKPNNFTVFNKTAQNDNLIRIQTDFTTFNEILFGGKSILKAILKSKLSITPLSKMRRGIRFLSLLTLGNRWYIPRLDQI
jgi:hypothetical protein